MLKENTQSKPYVQAGTAQECRQEQDDESDRHFAHNS